MTDHRGVRPSRIDGCNDRPGFQPSAPGAISDVVRGILGESVGGEPLRLPEAFASALQTDQ